MFRLAAACVASRAPTAMLVRPGLSCVHHPLKFSLARMQSTLSRPEIETRVMNVFKSYAPGDKLRPDASFQDLGLDSLDAVELMVAVEEEFGIEIPDKESDEIKSVRDAIDYIEGQPEAR